ncbi:MAG: hypothetical protein Q8L27_03690 [archaeon]|nr:hypothetical protein [archaeon]
MVKKSASGKVKPLSNRELQFALIENFVNLQKVLTNMTVKFDNLSDNITKLLQIFEISAKSFIQKQQDGSGEEKDVLKKLDTLLEQNRTVAKGLTLIEEKIRHKVYGDLPQEGLPHLDFSGRPRPSRVIP